MYILASMWFTKLIKQFFFWIDKIVFNFISTIYDLMITIARTSPLSQSDILDMAGRVYKLLAVFMIFKVTLSLITYVVNPDDFTDKTKGISKLGTNIIISLSLLILTPYIFNYAYQFQTIILEDNTLATLIFGDNTEKQKFFNSAGDDMAYLTFSAFLTPNLSLGDLWQCTNLLENGKINSNCRTALENEQLNSEGNFDDTTLNNYIVAIENNSLGMLLRQDLVTATNGGNHEFIMDYKFIFSTIVGVIVILLLLSFCMDVAVRSIKLAFLQLIAPVPILSYVDPKSGKDGMFKKWYQMCFKTYLSLFIRLLALYFSVYIISMVASHGLVDIIDGSTQTNGIVKIFIIIGALMFAKQFPKILEGLGIKLDGGSKFTLNPLKKFEEGAIGGKRITGAARGFAVGAAGALSGAGAGRAFSGAFRGFKGGKGWSETGKAEAEMNRKMRQAKLDGSTFRGRMGAKFAGATGLMSASERIADEKKTNQNEIDRIDDQIKGVEEEKKRIKGSAAYLDRQQKLKDQKALADSIKAMETRAKEEIQQGNSDIGKEYLRRKAHAENLRNHGITTTREATSDELRIAQNRVHDLVVSGASEEQISAAEQHYASLMTNGVTETRRATAEEIAAAELSMNDYLSKEGMKEYMTKAIAGDIPDGTFKNLYENAKQAAENMGKELETTGEKIHKQFSTAKEEIGNLERAGNDDARKLAEYDAKIDEYNRDKSKYNDNIRELNKREAKAKADESVK